MDHMGVIVEMWPLAADTRGIWLVSGTDALRSSRISQDSTVAFEAENLLRYDDALLIEELPVLHSPSWRPDNYNVILTYFAVLDEHNQDVVATWPQARPVDVEKLLALHGGPLPHGAAEEPLPRDLDVLFHALRHLRLLMGGEVTILGMDAEVSAALSDVWKAHLYHLTPALAGLYSRRVA